jgi:hypothetical protein
MPARAATPALELPARPPAPVRNDKREVAVHTADVPHLAAFRERVRTERARTAEPPPVLWPDAPSGWREDAVAWAQAALAELDDVEAPASTPCGALVSRFELSAELQPALALLYGVHLLGIGGAAPVLLARMLGGWDEALGRGELAARGVVEVRDSRLHLSAPVLRVLDELSPLTGTLVGTAGPVSLLGPCTVVSTSPLAIVAEACAPTIGGAILAGHAGIDPRELVREARAYGAAPMLRVAVNALERVPTDEPIILVVDSDAMADQLGLPRLG